MDEAAGICVNNPQSQPEPALAAHESAGNCAAKSPAKSPAGQPSVSCSVHGSPPAGPSDGPRGILAALYAPIRTELAEAEAVLRRELHSPHPPVERLAQHAFRLGGKRLRPALTLLAGSAAGQLGPAHPVLAAVMEMIHTATLVHDDILDSARVRRHELTVNQRFGNQASVLLGDYLFTHAFFLASTLGDAFACQLIGQATNATCEGELRQTAAAGDLSLDEAEYLDLIGAKTAELCACCCRLGARFAKATSAAERALERYGRSLGLAFQIADDVLDLLGSEDAVGKSLGTDLDQLKLTLPVIHWLANLPAQQRNTAATELAQPGRAARRLVVRRMHESGAVEYALDRAADLANQARTELVVLSDSPAREALLRLAQFAVERNH